MSTIPPYKLLFVEDEIETRTNIINYLRNIYDFEYITASNGLEAWNLYLKYKPEIIITDLKMDHLCGLELIEKIRDVDLEAKIIIISAYSEKEKLLKAVKLNLIEYLIKPINRKEIRDTINNILTLLQEGKKTKKIYFSQTNYYDRTHKTLFFNNESIKLSKKEFTLLEMLSDNSSSTIEIPEIINYIWQEDTASAQSVRTLVKKLRKKLPKNTIDNVYGGGYKINLYS